MNENGATLIELTVSVLLAGIVLAGAYTLFLFADRGAAHWRVRASAHASFAAAQHRISADLRDAYAVSSVDGRLRVYRVHPLPDVTYAAADSGLARNGVPLTRTSTRLTASSRGDTIALLLRLETPRDTFLSSWSHVLHGRLSEWFEHGVPAPLP